MNSIELSQGGSNTDNSGSKREVYCRDIITCI